MSEVKDILVTSSRQPVGFMAVLAVQFWEYFSYYGMRSLLVLYLTGPLLLSDTAAYHVYGAYTSMVYVTPVIGGYVADKLLGYRHCVTWGALLMVAGHATLGFSGQSQVALYVALALIVCGYGLFKTNVSCLLGSLYHEHDTRRESGFTLMYIGGNVGALLSPLIVGWVLHYWGWHAALAVAAVGMAVGLVIFYAGRHHFTASEKKRVGSDNTRVGVLGYGLAMALSVVLVTVILWYQWVDWILITVVLMSAGFIVGLYWRCNEQQRRTVMVLTVFMLFCVVFWAFDQQGGSSISLFIERHVDRNILGYVVPVPMFQAINPGALLLIGSGMAWLWRILSERGIDPKPLSALLLGLMMLTAGFTCIALGAHEAIRTGVSHPGWVIVGLALVGAAELFVDPVALALITRLNLPKATGTLAGIYMLASGAVGNYLAAYIAQYMAVDSQSGSLSSSAQASIYYEGFAHIMQFGVGVSVFLLVLALLFRRVG